MDAAALLALYRACHYAVRVPGGQSRATLRIDEPVPGVLNDWLGTAPFGAFMTAHNPRSLPRPAADNRTAQRTLLAAIRAAGARTLPGVGRIPGQSWREPSLFVAGLDIATVDALAQRHAQNAIVLGWRGGIAQLRTYTPA